jgi:hypothetical protein
MPSAKMGPDQKHALEALSRRWVFPPSGIDRLSHYILFALPKLVSRGTPASAWSMSSQAGLISVFVAPTAYRSI